MTALALSHAGGRWRRVRVVIGKELVDHFRDRRALVLGLFYPLLGPMLLAASLYVSGNIIGAEREPGAIEVPAKGIEYAPQFVAHLASKNIVLTPATGDLLALVRGGGAAMAFEIPPEAAAGPRFTLRVYTDYSKLDNLRATQYVGGIVSQYNRDEAGRLAREAGLRDDFLITVAIDQVNVSRPADMAVFLYNLMPPLIMFMIFLAGVHVSVDMTAGERERGTLEPLLITPIERSGLLLGKASVGLVMTAMTVAMNLGGFRILLGLAAAAHPEMTPPPAVGVFLAIFALAVPLMILAVALQVAIAIISRSMKEAQIYLGLLPLIPALPGMVLVFSPLAPNGAIATVPLLGQLALFNKLVQGEPVAAGYVLASAGVTLALAAIVFWQAQRLFAREKALLGG